MPSTFKITVTKQTAQLQTGTAIELVDGPKSSTVYEQAFDEADFDLRNFVRSLNAQPRRRRRTKTEAGA